MFLLIPAVSAALLKRQTTATPTSNLFPISPEIYPGNTATGAPAALAATNPVNGYGLPNATQSYVAPNPLVTNEVIPNNTDNINIADYWGNLTPYRAASGGFGVEEYALPEQCSIKQVNWLQRHGARYPTADASTATLAAALAKANGTFTGDLSFLNGFTYKLGAEILTPVGRQQLFDSGVQGFYQYRYLYDNSTKLVARTTSQDRILKSAEYWLSGFFGLDWQQYANLEVIIEAAGFNNSLASYDTCTNANNPVDSTTSATLSAWERKYLASALTRLQASSKGFNWTIPLVYAAQQMCPYETVALGYSAFCQLFTADEWKGFEYSVDISFEQGGGFGSSTGRASGIGYVDELLDRITHIMPNSTIQGVNTTLDFNPIYFPLNQTLNIDFTHDIDITSTVAALGLTQFAEVLPASGPPSNQQYIASKVVPFGARLITEVIECSSPIVNHVAVNGSQTHYIHISSNQRTIPLGASFSICGNRSDGWCELGNFLQAQANRSTLADYEYACFGNYNVTSNITDGRPLRRSVPVSYFDFA